MNKKVTLIVAIIILMSSFGIFLAVETADKIRTSLPPISNSLPTINPLMSPKNLLIYTYKPVANEVISKSPIIISGEAVGYWFFEASFPIKIYDAEGSELGVAIAQAQADWMTEGLVPFIATLNIKKPATETGFIVLEKDNPSGLPENNNSLRIDIKFDLINWSNDRIVQDGCLITGCSGQICSEEEVITTCEIKAEYTCYQNAICKKQVDGKCGWTQSDDLVSCLNSPNTNIESE